MAAGLSVNLRKPIFRNFRVAKGVHNGRYLYLAKSLTYMNQSGQILRGLLRHGRGNLSNLVVVCDTLDLPPGSCRLKIYGSSAGHRGLESIIRYAGSPDFLRLYIGIGRPASQNGVIDHVLGEPDPRERNLINRSFERAERGILQLLVSPPEKVMNDLNERESRS